MASNFFRAGARFAKAAGGMFQSSRLQACTFAAATTATAALTAQTVSCLRIEEDTKLDFKDVLIRPARSTLRSRSEVNLARTFKFKYGSFEWTGVPIIAANMDTTGTFEMACELSKHGVLVAIHKHYTVDQWAEFAKNHPDVIPFVAVSAGTSKNDTYKVDQIIAATGVQMICLDVANGYSEFFVEAVKSVRAKHPTKVIMAGNVVTDSMTEQLILNGADIVKVGIGPGSVCTTRRQTGVGYPQLSAVIECAVAAHGLGGHVIADGGITCPGDAAKAFGGGADFIMMGGMLAGHDESGGEVVEVDGKKMKKFYGMSSAVAMKKHVGGVASYRSSEGKAVHVPYRGPVAATIMDMMGGLRSTCTYVGAATLADLPVRTTFIKVSMQLNEVFGKAK
jgi:GMP reductase